MDLFFKIFYQLNMNENFYLLMQELYLRNNELVHLPPDVFGPVARLSQLVLIGNHLKVVDGSTFARMPGKTPNVPISQWGRGG